MSYDKRKGPSIQKGGGGKLLDRPWEKGKEILTTPLFKITKNKNDVRRKPISIVLFDKFMDLLLDNRMGFLS